MLVDIQKLFLYVGVGLFGDQKTRKSVLSFHRVGPGGIPGPAGQQGPFPTKPHTGNFEGTTKIYIRPTRSRTALASSLLSTRPSFPLATSLLRF